MTHKLFIYHTLFLYCRSGYSGRGNYFPHTGFFCRSMRVTAVVTPPVVMTLLLAMTMILARHTMRHHTVLTAVVLTRAPTKR
jgi:hypothetical protein